MPSICDLESVYTVPSSVCYDSLCVDFSIISLQVLRDCIHKVGAELDIDVPSAISTKANASTLYPMVLEENIKFSEWSAWCRLRLFESLKSYGYIQQTQPSLNIARMSVDTNISALSEAPGSSVLEGLRTPRKVSWDKSLVDDDTDSLPNKPHESITKVLIDRHRRQSSLFGKNTFPMNESYDLFAGNVLSGDESDHLGTEHLTQPIHPEDADSVNASCLVM